uniref:Receptor-like protein kinase 5 n=1 Tax=Cajanus cajan TaxID=3821 RepID=A0A151TT03_CAJCA|nr:Receptor-like protein kinase 5 [Cajanus cajan]
MLDLSDNSIAGELPTTLYNCSNLRHLDLSQNYLAGTIPADVDRLKTLTHLNLGGNSFSGEIPAAIGNLPELQTLQLFTNPFNGTIPREIGSLSNLEYLGLAYNVKLSPAKIPLEFAKLRKLRVMWMTKCNLIGEIPESFGNLTNLERLDLSVNNLTGRIPRSLFSLRKLKFLYLFLNGLSGVIPSTMQCLDLIDVDLARNNLTGFIPREFGKLKSLSTLHLYSNQLSGEIPISISLIPSLKYFRVYGNNLSGTLPPELGLHSRLIAFEFSENQISGGLPEHLCDGGVLMGVVAFSNNLKNNLIGSGGFGKVYRVASNRPGEYVAVKKIWNRRDVDDKLMKEFMAEVEILGNIRHSNIVKLLCCYSSENSKVLVYEYMENQSLDKWLHGKLKTSPNGLSWPTRLNIAIGAAQGLCYMHHEFSPPIIHRDVKSSNILLDSEFRAKIADFGLAKMLTKPGEPHTMSTLAGSFGYIPPEYAYSTKINEKVDVYSFGVVLLELVTGKKPNKGGEPACSLVDWAWDHFSEGKSLADAFYEDIKDPRYEEEMASVFKLGLLCTRTLPSTRPSTKDILKVLRHCHSGSTRTRVGHEFDINPLLSDTRYIYSYKESNAASNNSSW